MIIGIDKGHAIKGSVGASAILNEVAENRKIGNRLIAMLKEKGHTVFDCSVDESYDVNNQLAGIVNKANAQKLDLFVSIHLNAGGGHGTETYIYNGSYSFKESNRATAKKVNDAVVSSCGFRNRGVKEGNLYVLRGTISPAILVEVCFVDSQEDANKINTEAIAKAMFKGITGADYVSISSQPEAKELYRIRKTWEDSASQKGAYSNLDSAIAECKNYAGYSVFNSNGVKVYPIPAPTTSDNEISRYSESGRFTTTTDLIYFRDKPSTVTGTIQGSYLKNESVNYDLVVITEKYVWISWIGGTGSRRYMPITDRKTNEKWGICV